MAGLRSGDAAVPGEPPPAYVEFPSQMPPPSVSSSSLLPQYSCDLAFEAVFRMKMEIEDTVKRAEDRHWRSVFVHLRGPALYVYSVRRDWSWSGSGSRAGRSGGPGISSDNPPWLRRAKLEKTYTLLHADVGIAADYPKYVFANVAVSVVKDDKPLVHESNALARHLHLPTTSYWPLTNLLSTSHWHCLRFSIEGDM